MPRIIKGLEEPRRPQFPDLLAELADELENRHEAGQPRIEELHFPRTQAIRVTVIWDKWAPLSDEERSAVILQAYERSEGEEFRNRIALAIGLTVPEAYESGLLPFRIMAAIRPGDKVTEKECAKAMREQGASLLFDPKRPQLRFASQEEAEACLKRLAKALPHSKQVWVITKDDGRVEEIE